MKQYYKNENGTKVFYREPLKLNGMQYFNPSEEQILEAGWIEYTPPPVPSPTEEELLQQAKENKISEILAYDRSSEINICYISYGGVTLEYWADKNERNALKNAVQDCIALGRENYRLDLRELNVSMAIPCANMVAMLQALEGYAIDCYNNTTDHIYNVQAMHSMSEVDEYDYTTGYPEKLTFNIE